MCVRQLAQSNLRKSKGILRTVFAQLSPLALMKEVRGNEIFSC